MCRVACVCVCVARRRSHSASAVPQCAHSVYTLSEEEIKMRMYANAKLNNIGNCALAFVFYECGAKERRRWCRRARSKENVYLLFKRCKIGTGTTRDVKQCREREREMSCSSVGNNDCAVRDVVRLMARCATLESTTSTPSTSNEFEKASAVQYLTQGTLVRRTQHQIDAS